MEDIMKNVLKQLENNVNEHNEPEAYIDLPSKRNIEIVKEQYGLDVDKYYYSIRLHCNEDEFDSGKYDGSIGILGTFVTNKISTKELENVIKSAIKLDHMITQESGQDE